MQNLSQLIDQIAQHAVETDLGLPLKIVLALLLGLLSSISPCVLGLLPVNLAYIGTAHIESRREAFTKAGLFVVGVSLVLALLGAFGSLAFAVFTDYKAVIHLGVGLFIIVMALFVAELIKIPLPQFVDNMPEANPFVIGVVFALVSSPCSSPILFAVLSITTGLSSLAAVLVMFAYSLGYTAIIFFASLFAGLAKQLNWFKQHHELVTKTSALLLLLMGVFYAWVGIRGL